MNYKKFQLSVFFLVFAVSLSFLFLVSFASSENISIIPPVMLLVCAILYTLRLHRKKIINAPQYFIGALAVKVLVTAFVYYFCWYRPLNAMGVQNIDDQQNYLGFQDSMLYEFHAGVVSQMPIGDWFSASHITWQSEGVVLYLAGIYRVFGVEPCNIIFINVLIGYLAVLQIFYIDGIGLSDMSSLVVLVPHNLYYDFPPGKEVIVNLFLYAFLSRFYLFIHRRGVDSIKNLCLMSIAIIILSVLRVNLAVMIILVSATYIVVFTKRRLEFAVWILGICFLAVFMSDSQFQRYAEESFGEAGTSAKKLSDDDGMIKKFLAENLYTGVLIIDICLSPIHALVWLISPLPNVDFAHLYNAIVKGDDYAIFTLGPKYSRMCSSVCFLIFAVLPNKIREMKIKFRGWLGFRFTCIMTGTLSCLIAYSALIQGARYRVMVEPLIFVLILVPTSGIRIRVSKVG